MQNRHAHNRVLHILLEKVMSIEILVSNETFNNTKEFIELIKTQ